MLARRLGERGVAPAARLLDGNALALAIATVARDGLCEQTAAAAARYALGHDIAATTAAHVLAAIRGTTVAAIFAKLKGVAAGGAAGVGHGRHGGGRGGGVRWDVVQSHLPDAVRSVIDWARSPWKVPVPRPAGPPVPDTGGGESISTNT
jgi:hypothetical protein